MNTMNPTPSTGNAPTETPQTETTQTETTPADIMLDTDINRPTRIGRWLIGWGLGSFLLWATLAPLASGVNGNGSVIVTGERKTIQHLTGGIIEHIPVHDGQRVAANALLVRLNTSESGAEMEIVRAQLITARAVEARLIAEQTDQESPLFNDPILQNRKDPVVNATVALQQSLFTTRRGAQKNAVAILQSGISQLDAQQQALKVVVQRYNEQIALLNKQLSSVRSLSAEGYYPRNKLLDLERELADIQTDLAQSQVEISRLTQARSEAELKLLQQQVDYRKEVETQLTDIQQQASGLRDRLTALQFQVEHAEILAPLAGWIVDMKVTTVGGVIQPGQPIMDLVPDNQILSIKARFPLSAIDKLVTGLPVDIRLTSLNRPNTPVIEGVVDTVSADQLVDDRTGEPYLQATVSITDEGKQTLLDEKIDLRPGVPTDVFVRTGQQTLAVYLIKPLKDRMASAMTEP